MEKLNIKREDIAIHNVIYAITTHQDYEMARYLFIESMYGDVLSKKTDEYVYIIGEGWHCSCYDFDDTKFEFIGYKKEDLKKLAEIKSKENSYYSEEQTFYEFINDYLA